MELKKLDFPTPTGPRSRTRARDTEASVGLYVLMVSSSSALFLKKKMFMNLPVDLCDLCCWCRSRVAYLGVLDRIFEEPSSSEGEQEGLVVGLEGPGLAEGPLGVASEHVAGRVVAHGQRAAAAVAPLVEGGSREPVDARFVQQAQFDSPQLRDEGPLLAAGQLGGHGGRPGRRLCRLPGRAGPRGSAAPPGEHLRTQSTASRLRGDHEAARRRGGGAAPLTQVADVLPQLPEGAGEAFRVRRDFRGVDHEGHAVDLLLEPRLLHVADGLRPHGLLRPELRGARAALTGHPEGTVNLWNLPSNGGRDISRPVSAIARDAPTLWPSGA
ncbi:hypothetical protein EYF80_048364 [Liparis tanakae]|uniref:Uncharacterized protein n=1 Tax=Liparis tanakae TaxID=230148 RepID=A0A4Z2FJY7_9TELE|nr:hypothetical protein EYF80_048364 [Liparis tanakae]